MSEKLHAANTGNGKTVELRSITTRIKNWREDAAYGGDDTGRTRYFIEVSYDGEPALDFTVAHDNPNSARLSFETWSLITNPTGA